MSPGPSHPGSVSALPGAAAPSRRAGPDAPERGFALLAVLVFVFLLSMVIASLLFQSAADESAASASAGSEQAWNAALSGVAELVRAAPKAGGPEPDWQDDPRRFKHQLVYDDGADRWYFTAFTPAPPDSLAEVRHGLTDDASRIHLGQATVDQLARLPRVTPELARALREAHGTTPVFTPSSAPSIPVPAPDTSGAGDASLDPFADTTGLAVAATNGFADSGTVLPGPRLLLGEDLNQNGRLDPNEDRNGDGNLDRGLVQYLTLDAADPDLDSSGKARIPLNDPSGGLPTVELPPAFTNYLAELRTSKATLDHPADTLEATLQTKNPQGAEVAVPSGIGPDELPLVLEHFTARTPSDRSARINVNTASAAVLATIPGIDESLAESIVSSRSAVAPERRRTSAWLVQEGLLTPAQFKSIAPHLTSRSYQFHCRVAGYGLPSGRFRVLDVGIDTSSGQPVITRLVDVTRLGFPIVIEDSGEAGGMGQTSGI